MLSGDHFAGLGRHATYPGGRGTNYQKKRTRSFTPSPSRCAKGGEKGRNDHVRHLTFSKKKGKVLHHIREKKRGAEIDLRGERGKRERRKAIPLPVNNKAQRRRNESAVGNCSGLGGKKRMGGLLPVR